MPLRKKKNVAAYKTRRRRCEDEEAATPERIYLRYDPTLDRIVDANGWDVANLRKWRVDDVGECRVLTMVVAYPKPPR